jgi:hypothetical protein
MKSLDAYLPAYEFRERHELRVDADAAATETRVHVPDPVSRRRFSLYWRVIRPFRRLIRMLLLRAAKRRAKAVA